VTNSVASPVHASMPPRDRYSLSLPRMAAGANIVLDAAGMLATFDRRSFSRRGLNEVCDAAPPPQGRRRSSLSRRAPLPA
jgi:hypothetical protein